MMSCLPCFNCRLFLNHFSGLKCISQKICLYDSYVFLSSNFSNKPKAENSRPTLKVSASIDQTSRPTAFNEIYRFHGVRLGFYIHKLKWQQSAIAAVALPSSLALYCFGIIDSDWVIGVMVPGVLLTLNLYGYSTLFQNAVGFLYLSEDETTLKVSYLDFWGKRIDEEFPVDDVVPFLDAPRPPTDYIYKQLLFYSSDRPKLKLFMKLAKVTDKEKFDKVFGPLD